jgi:AcrR family transcriptional regulator
MPYAVKPVPRPRSLAPDQIAAAALAILDRDGLGALTMRAVAAELGMGTMSAYRYVEGREELERLVVERVLSTVDFEVPETLPWDERISVVAERIRRAVAEHPAVVPLLVQHRHDCDAVRRSGETFLGILAGAGFEGVERVIAFRSLLSYIVGAFEMEHLGPLSGTGTNVLAALPATSYPRLSETARDARKVPVEIEFREGLAILLDGLKSRVRA